MQQLLARRPEIRLRVAADGTSGLAEARAAPPALLLLSFGVWKVVEASGNALAMFLNGIRIVKTQVTVAIATAIVALGMKIFLVNTIGISGVNWATIFAFCLCALIPYFFILRNYFSGPAR